MKYLFNTYFRFRLIKKVKDLFVNWRDVRIEVQYKISEA